MAARLRKMHQDDVRAKIKTSQLINRLEDHALGTLDLSPTQIKAIEVLVRKTLPDLSAVVMTGENGGPIETIQRIERHVIDPHDPNTP
jgi:hypothetical protein